MRAPPGRVPTCSPLIGWTLVTRGHRAAVPAAAAARVGGGGRFARTSAASTSVRGTQPAGRG